MSGFYITSGTERFLDHIGKDIREVVCNEMYENLKYFEEKKIVIDDNLVMHFRGNTGVEYILYIEGIENYKDYLDKNLIEIFSNTISTAFENTTLNLQLQNSHKEIIFTLGEIAEARSKETSKHVKRVAEFSRIIALRYGMSEEEAEVIALASAMHDIGKLGIQENVLNKPGKLTPEEFEIIKSHSMIGYEMLKNSDKETMKTAAIIALQHHEKYDGTGYPYGLKGEEIHIYGRITAIADVFDALGTKRVYKPAWELEEVLEHFRKERGKHFDPNLIDIFFENIDDILKIRDTFPDDICDDK